MLKAHDLYKIYKEGSRELYAVSNVSLEARKGELLVIVGSSGAGKSTLLHLLGGLDTPDRGKVLLDGIDLYKIRDDKRSRLRNEKIGFVFQSYHLLPEFTALENVLLPTMIRRKKSRPKERARAQMILETVGLKERINHRPGELSGGEAQRVAIARALINDPEIIFCDEPTGNLDSKISKDICSLIARLNRERKATFVIVTHETSLADMADRKLYIKDGALSK